MTSISLAAFGYVAMLLAGASLGLLGGGGAILTVPIMVYLFETPAWVATSYSLFVVGISSLVGAWRYHRRQQVDYRTAALFALPSFAGTHLARQVVVPALPSSIALGAAGSLSKDQLVLTAFAVVMLGASLAMIRGRGGSQDQSEATRLPAVSTLRASIALLGLGLAVGFVAGFVGAGGGFLIIPALVLVAGMPMPAAVGTSLLIIAANSLVGFTGDVVGGADLAWRFLLVTTAIALIGILAGSYASRWIPSARLRPAFGWFILAMGAFVLVQQYLH